MLERASSRDIRFEVVVVVVVRRTSTGASARVGRAPGGRGARRCVNIAKRSDSGGRVQGVLDSAPHAHGHSARPAAVSRHLCFYISYVLARRKRKRGYRIRITHVVTCIT